ncbi:MAG: 4Fe-4S binding protein [Gammaproteobacteria bacterium]|nr:4Fe-4S binding protein [Gammaproteobacteria bacterium]
MNKIDKIYIELQKHLDQQAVGFPATKSGVEIRLLKELFTLEQASLALYLHYQPQSVLDIFAQAKSSDLSLEKVKSMLEEMEDNGSIMSMLKNGSEHYFLIPLLVGVVELHSEKATAQFWQDFHEYLSGEFGKAYANTKVSQLRTIPVRKSIPIEYHVSSYDNIRELINNTAGPIAVGKCVCREGAKHKGQPCQVTTRYETCMGFGSWARHSIKAGIFREITREEALEITRQNEEDGLVLQPSNSQKSDFVCACCGCCCGVLKLQKHLPKPAENWAHNFYAAVENDKCIACGMCVKKCQVGAIDINKQSGCATINLDRCIGCGNCAAFCPTQAMKLVKKEKETVPPQDSTSLYKILSEKN